MARTLERKVLDRFVYEGFGFPVVLVQVPMVRVRREWTPDVNFDALSKRLLKAVAEKLARLTGAEVRFVRHSLSMTLEEFASRFGVTHPAVLKWEGCGNHPTAMSWAIEKDIRLEILRSFARLKPSEFLDAYRDFAKKPARKRGRIRIELPQTA
jgi:DNA-binding transcriptional regulator YiaG